jgi:hypothetical protein
MQKRKSITPKVCVYCGGSSAPTRDHVPPKAIFPRPHPNDLVTVPSCQACNTGISQQDEEFAYFLSLYVGAATLDTKTFFSQRAVGTARHNRRLREHVRSTAQPIYFTTAAGVIFDRGVKIPWRSQAHQPILHRIIRGLYYHAYGEVLPPTHPVEAKFATRLPDPGVQLPWSTGQLAGGRFRYAYCRAPEDRRQSLWLFEFYARLWAIGSTLEEHAA